jgi:hypothetical protein
VSISQHAERLFPVFFIYDETGHPTWHLLDAGSWTFGVATYYQGTLISPKASPFYAYDPKRFEAGRSSGFAFLDFEAGIPVKLLLDVAFPQLAPRYVSIEPFQLPPSGRQDRGVSDIWWGGPSQSGWGVSITEQNGSLFLVWFTYDDAGKATWYAMTEGSWTGDATWSGPIERTSGAPVGTPADYDPSRFRADRVGSFSVRFVDDAHAVMDYVLEGRSGTLVLERFEF